MIANINVLLIRKIRLSFIKKHVGAYFKECDICRQQLQANQTPAAVKGPKRLNGFSNNCKLNNKLLGFDNAVRCSQLLLKAVQTCSELSFS